MHTTTTNNNKSALYEEIVSLVATDREDGARLLEQTFRRGLLHIAALTAPRVAWEATEDALDAAVTHIRTGEITSSELVPFLDAYVRRSAIELEAATPLSSLEKHRRALALLNHMMQQTPIPRFRSPVSQPDTRQ